METEQKVFDTEDKKPEFEVPDTLEIIKQEKIKMETEDIKPKVNEETGNFCLAY